MNACSCPRGNKWTPEGVEIQGPALGNVGDACGCKVKLSGVLLNLAKLKPAELDLSIAASETLTKVAAWLLCEKLARAVLKELGDVTVVDRIGPKLIDLVREGVN
jgi:hypothetical protein